MMNQVLRQAGKAVIHKQVADQTKPGGFLNFRLGFAMMRDRRVPIGPKIVSLGIGAFAVAVPVALEVPLEALLGVFVPLLGFAADVAIDGLEVIVLPILIGCLVLPKIAGVKNLSD